jgi:hypothetical protein
MFRLRWWMAGLIGLAMVLTFAIAADWKEIVRTIRKQSDYKGKPKYALLVFGPEAKMRVWIVEDGETLYVDRNGDGDLTGEDERFTLTLSGNKNQHGSLQDCNIEIPDSDKKTPYVITSISIRPEPDGDDADAERHIMVNVDIKGQVSYRQYCDAKLVENPEKAAIAHFHGPLTIGPQTVNWKLTPGLSRLSLGDSPSDIRAVVGTMDAERGCWVVVRSEDLPKDLHPVLEVEYPGKKAGDAPIKKRYRLEQRC